MLIEGFHWNHNQTWKSPIWMIHILSKVSHEELGNKYHSASSALRYSQPMAKTQKCEKLFYFIHFKKYKCTCVLENLARSWRMGIFPSNCPTFHKNWNHKQGFLCKANFNLKTFLAANFEIFFSSLQFNNHVIINRTRRTLSPEWTPVGWVTFTLTWKILSFFLM